MNKVSAKGGRPSLPEHRKRTHDVRVLFNDMEYAIVKAKAVVAGREVSDYARQALLSAEVAGHENPGKDLPSYRLSVGEFARILILKSTVTAAVTPEQMKLFKDFGVEVRNIGINLNRLAKAVNAGDPKDYAAEIRKALEDLSRIKDDFMKKLLKDDGDDFTPWISINATIRKSGFLPPKVWTCGLPMEKMGSLIMTSGP